MLGIRVGNLSVLANKGWELVKDGNIFSMRSSLATVTMTCDLMIAQGSKVKISNEAYNHPHVYYSYLFTYFCSMFPLFHFMHSYLFIYLFIYLYLYNLIGSCH